MTPSPEERAAYARKAKPPWNLKAAESEIARLREELRLNADTLEAAEQQVVRLEKWNEERTHLLEFLAATPIAGQVDLWIRTYRAALREGTHG